MSPVPVPLPVRSTYRHGDLRRALLEAGIALARSGGPEAVVLREVTRQAGVVPNAAYRHFGSRQELLKAYMDATNATRDFWTRTAQMILLNLLLPVLTALLGYLFASKPSGK